MRIINMLDDYEKLCDDSEINGNWIAWGKYVSLYKDLFSAILKGLYMTDLESLKPMIEGVDFKEIYNKAVNQVKVGYVEEIIKLVELSLKKLEFTDEFDLYIGCELGNINGFVLPTNNNTISVYFGLETITDLLKLKTLVPHEINHLARISELMRTKTFKMENLNYFKDRLVSEGLGVFTPFKILHLDDTIEGLARVLGIPESAVLTLLKNEKELETEILGQLENMLNSTLMNKYFAYSTEDLLENKPIYCGYFIGFRIIQKLYDKKKLSLKQLTKMPANEIIEEYIKLGA